MVQENIMIFETVTMFAVVCRMLWTTKIGARFQNGCQPCSKAICELLFSKTKQNKTFLHEQKLPLVTEWVHIEAYFEDGTYSEFYLLKIMFEQ